MNLSNGFVYMPRLEEEHILNHLEPEIEKLFWYLLKKARYKKEPSCYGVERGELATSLATISENCSYEYKGRIVEWSKAKIKRMLEKLDKYKLISYQPNAFGTRITVCNYSETQDKQSYEANGNETVTKRKRNGNETQANGSVTLNKKEEERDKKDKNDKNDKKTTLWKEEEILILEIFNLKRMEAGLQNLQKTGTNAKPIKNALKKFGLEKVEIVCESYVGWADVKYLKPTNALVLSKFEDKLQSALDAKEAKHVTNEKGDMSFLNACDGFTTNHQKTNLTIINPRNKEGNERLSA